MPDLKFTEIERKFLVNNDSWKQKAVSSGRVTQGYLSPLSLSGAKSTSRVRILESKGIKKAWLTFKSNNPGVSRSEYENSIPVEQAEAMLAELAMGSIIEKTRHLVPLTETLMIEIDEFHGENEGLVIAEIELSSEDEEFEKPDYLGNEVTHVGAYFNISLVNNPYKSWNKGRPVGRTFLKKSDYNKCFLTANGKSIVRPLSSRQNDRNDVFEVWQIIQSLSPIMVGKKLDMNLTEDLSKGSFDGLQVVNLDDDMTQYVLLQEGEYESLRDASNECFYFHRGLPVAKKIRDIFYNNQKDYIKSELESIRVTVDAMLKSDVVRCSYDLQLQLTRIKEAMGKS